MTSWIRRHFQIIFKILPFFDIIFWKYVLKIYLLALFKKVFSYTNTTPPTSCLYCVKWIMYSEALVTES